ncbi:MAG: hypothetical protein QOF53_2625 [Nocardioidaceae bacterium]|jgi:hypothetical protein|nr:hypothetical protein [Nocardioidaceae bacterium]
MLLVVLLAGSLEAAGPTSSAQAATTVKVRLRTAVHRLPVAAETRSGYRRTTFRLWVDADHDCRDTRDEVLAAESRTRVSGCDVRRGRWMSYYDRRTFTRSSGLDIDHLVPLAEAWDSGARKWSAGTRQRYANDLGDSRTLVAVSASTNRSKGDRDVAQWLPRHGRCRYVSQWTAVKTRWGLTVDRAEKRRLTRLAAGCANVVLTLHRAKVVRGGSTPPTHSGDDPRFDTCADAKAAGYGPYYRGRDPEYRWYRDGDSDGVVCE